MLIPLDYYQRHVCKAEMVEIGCMVERLIRGMVKRYTDEGYATSDCCPSEAP